MCRRLLISLLVVVSGATACAGMQPHHSNAATHASDTQAAAVAQSLVVGFGDSQSVRYEDARCAPVHGLGNAGYVCALEEIGLHGANDGFELTAVPIADGQPFAAAGLTQTTPACLERPACWAQQLRSHCLGDCSAAPRVGLPGPAFERRRRALAPTTVGACMSAWDLHGGFSPDETQPQLPAVLPVREVEKPVYTSYLAPSSMGLIATRARIAARGPGCRVTFDLGKGRGYAIATAGGRDPWTWTWQGAAAFTVAPAAPNACQRPDGTLAASGCPTAPAGLRRDVANELYRRHLAVVAELGGFPYWLGAPFRGAWPQAHPEGDLAVVTYTVLDRGRQVRVTITTGYTPTIPASAITGRVIVRARPEDTAAVVTTDRRASPALVRAVRGALRPFRADDPGAKQRPGDVQAASTLIDQRQPRRPLWFGPGVGGLRGAAVTDAPAGVGVVRYGAAGAPDRFYVVTYRPLPRNCGSLGCASPPPLPAALRRSGAETHRTWLLANGWLTTILAPHPTDAAAPLAHLFDVSLPTPAQG
ncbi:MAG TPA: hypothetical protein VGJ11_09455 [Gaiellales bacterium]